MPPRAAASPARASRLGPCAAAILLVAGAAGGDPARPSGLEPVGSQHIAQKKAGFSEPSGLVLAPGEAGFLSVSDGTGALFRLSGEGAVRERIDLGKHTAGLEGVAWDAAGARVLMVREDSAEILAAPPDDPGSLERYALEDMAGYRAVAELFARRDNNGLEGITVVPDTGTIVVVKENTPRLLLELSADLSTIRGALVLTAAMGFAVPGVSDAELDVSGIAWDDTLKRLWITSDTGRAVFLLDPVTKRATGYPLTRVHDTGPEPLDNAEGVAVSTDGRTLFVVTDDGHSSRLMSYAVR